MRHRICFAVGLVAAISTLVSTATPLHASTATFEDISLPASPGYSNNVSFNSGGLKFNNAYESTYGTWSGWSTSKVNDTTTAGFTNQYAAYTGTGDGGSGNYGVAFHGGSYGLTPSIIAPTGEFFQSLRITNTTYTALSMLKGDSFAKKFGGTTGNDEDYLKLIITGKKGGSEVGSIDFYLADYRFADNSQDYILDQWKTVNLSSLVGADTLTFAFASSDVGQYGINTPTYFAADNIVTTVPEPGSAILLLVAAMLSLGTIRPFHTTSSSKECK